MFKTLTLVFLIWAGLSAAAAEVPEECKGKYDADFDNAYMAKHSSQSVRYISAAFSDEGGKSLSISVLVRDRDDDRVYSDTYSCANDLCTSKGEKDPSLRVAETSGQLTIRLVAPVILVDEEHGDNITLSNSPGGDDVFQLSQLTDEDDCS